MIKITADSTCDLPNEVLEELNISIAPLHILIDEDDYLDGVNISPNDIFTYVGEENRTCTTTAINTFEYEQFFSKYTEDFDAVIHINLGSGFSSCHQNARLAAETFPNVYVIDSENLTTGSAHFIFEAASLAKAGKSVDEIIKALKNLTKKVQVSFVIDKMDYLKKGGRCSSVEAFGAAVLKIKPSIEVKDGKLIVGKKYRGNLKSSIEKYVKDQLANIDSMDSNIIFITHASCSPEIVAVVHEMLAEKNYFEHIIETKAGCTVSAHCGPNTLGLMYKFK